MVKLEEETSSDAREQMLRVQVTARSCPQITINIQEQIAEVDHFILDIDLDFYSTLNPFVTLYSEAKLYDKLRDLYRYGHYFDLNLPN